MGSCSSIPGVEVYAFEDEAELLAAWARYMVACDPDIITGYNIQNFDIDYLMKRARRTWSWRSAWRSATPARRRRWATVCRT